MAKFVAEIIALNGPTFVKTAKGGYNVAEVAYKKDGKVEGKKILDFVNQEVFNFVKGLKQGDKIDITSEKDNNGYWQWTSVSFAGEGAEQAVGEAGEAKAGDSQGNANPARYGAASSGASQSSGRGKVTGSNYETAEERAKNRACIRRQACLNTAVSSMTEEEKGKVAVADIIKVAEQFETWVLEAK